MMRYLVSTPDGQDALLRGLQFAELHALNVTTGHVGEAGKPNVTRIEYPDGFTVTYEPIA